MNFAGSLPELEKKLVSVICLSDDMIAMLLYLLMYKSEKR